MADYAPPDSQPADEDLQTLVRSQIEHAVTFVDGELSPERARLARYYEGELPDLPPPEGRSKAVATVVRDKLAAMKPGLLRAFFGPERVVEFRPRRADAVAEAVLQTEYINYIVTEDNPGLLILNAAIEDALVKELGVLKWWWEDAETTEGVTYEHLTLPDLEQLVARAEQEPGVDLTVESLEPNSFGGLKVALTVRKGIGSGKARFAAVPPEEFLFPRNARDLETCAFVAHRAMKTVSDLIAMGYDRAEVEDAVANGDEMTTNEETLQRAEWDSVFLDDDGSEATGEGGKPLRKVKYVESYLFYDQDKDGIAELRKVCMIGDDYQVMRNEPAAERPFAVMLADPRPHMLQGRGMAKRLDVNQKIQTVALRGMLDSLNLSLVQKTEIVEGQVNLKDALNPELGAIVRVKQPGMMREIKHSFVGPDVLPVLEYYEGKAEDAVGVSRAAAGLNPDALQSSTKAAVAQTISASQQQIELVARFLAETGLKPLFRGLYQLVKRHQSEARMVKLFGQFVPVNPASWDDADPDVTVNVALGLGLAEDRIASLREIAMDMEKIFGVMGAQNPIVTPKQYRDTLAKKVNLAGWKDAEQFYQPVDPNWQPPPQPEQPDPAAQLAQIEMAKVQGQQQLDMARLQLDREIAMQKQALDMEKLRLEDQRERDKMFIDAEVDSAKLGIEQEKVDVSRLQKAAVFTGGRMNELRPDEIVRRAERAKAVFHDPVFVEAMAALDARYVDNWRRATDPVTREKYWAAQAALQDVQDELERMIAEAIPATSASPRLSR